MAFEYMAYYFCNALESIVVPKNVMEIGGKAFSFCSNLKTAYVPEGLKYPSDAFHPHTEINVCKFDKTLVFVE